jgi:hypothetical protein
VTSPTNRVQLPVLAKDAEHSPRFLPGLPLKILTIPHLVLILRIRFRGIRFLGSDSAPISFFPRFLVSQEVLFDIVSRFFQPDQLQYLALQYSYGRKDLPSISEEIIDQAGRPIKPS